MSLIILGAASADKPVIDPMIFKSTVAQLLHLFEQEMNASDAKARQEMNIAKQVIVGEITPEKISDYFNGSSTAMSFYHRQGFGESLNGHIREIFEPVLRKDKVQAADIKTFIGEKIGNLLESGSTESELTRAMDLFDVHVEESEKRSMDEENKIRTNCLSIIKEVIQPSVNSMLSGVSRLNMGQGDKREVEVAIEGAKSVAAIYAECLDKISPQSTTVKSVLSFPDRAVKL